MTFICLHNVILQYWKFLFTCYEFFPVSLTNYNTLDRFFEPVEYETSREVSAVKHKAALWFVIAFPLSHIQNANNRGIGYNIAYVNEKIGNGDIQLIHKYSLRAHIVLRNELKITTVDCLAMSQEILVFLSLLFMNSFKNID